MHKKNNLSLDNKNLKWGEICIYVYKAVKPCKKCINHAKLKNLSLKLREALIRPKT